MAAEQESTEGPSLERLSPFHVRIRDFLFANLRTEHSYMTIDAIDDIVSTTISTFEQKITPRAETETLPPLSGRINNFVFANLREEYPYMKIDAAKEAAKDSVRAVEDRIQKQQPIMHISMERSGFMSLSAELRLLIYELALRPQEDGGGGIKGSHAIFIGVDDIAEDNCASRSKIYGYRTTSWIQQPALTKLSRQVRAETLPVYYGNHFVMEVGGCSAPVEFKIETLRRLRQNRNMKALHSWPAERRPVQWFRRMGPHNVAMITNLEILYAMPLSRTVMTVENMIEHLIFRNIPIPMDTAKILARQEVLDPTGEPGPDHWYPLPLTSTVSMERPLNLPAPRKDSLAYTSTDRRRFWKEKTGFAVAWNDRVGQYMVVVNRDLRGKRRRLA